VKSQIGKLAGLSVVAQIVVVGAMLMLVWAKRPMENVFWSNPYQKAIKERAAHSKEMRRVEIRQRFEQGVAMLQAGQYEYAITAFHRVVELDPVIPEAHVNLGFAFYGIGDFRGAERFFRAALALAPEMANAHYGRAISLAEQGYWAAAKSAMLRYLELSSERDPFLEKARLKLREIERQLNKQARQR
jgi:Flp pilus assembly protein TadD